MFRMMKNNIKNEKEEWIEDVFQSMKGSQRAKPNSNLLAKIDEKIASSSTNVIPLTQWRYAAAAAVLVLLINTSALFYYGKQNEVPYNEVPITGTYSQPLINTYQIYE